MTIKTKEYPACCTIQDGGCGLLLSAAMCVYAKVVNLSARGRMITVSPSVNHVLVPPYTDRHAGFSRFLHLFQGL